MNKKKLILLLAINSFFFFFVNIDVDIVNANQLIALWSWSIWCYMIYKLVFLLDYLSQNYLLKKNILLACLNYLLQIIFYILFVYIYVYDYLSINRDTILFLISINIVLELLLAFAMKSENKLYGVEEDKLNTDDIKEYILSRLIRQYYINIHSYCSYFNSTIGEYIEFYTVYTNDIIYFYMYIFSFKPFQI